MSEKEHANVRKRTCLLCYKGLSPQSKELFLVFMWYNVKLHSHFSEKNPQRILFTYFTTTILVKMSMPEQEIFASSIDVSTISHGTRVKALKF